MDDCANTLKDTWQADKEWWKMITKAEAGDVLFGFTVTSFIGGTYTETKPFSYSFDGNGKNILTGLTNILSGPYLYTSSANLMDIQKGFIRGFGSLNSLRIQFNWIGFYNINKVVGGPSFTYRNGYEKTEGAPLYSGTAGWAKWTAVLGSTGVCGLFGGGLQAASFCAGVTTVISDGVVDIFDVESNDYNVQVGPMYFNFQTNPNIQQTWSFEHIDYIE
jgi:hypothetical protein